MTSRPESPAPPPSPGPPEHAPHRSHRAEGPEAPEGPEGPDRPARPEGPDRLTAPDSGATGAGGDGDDSGGGSGGGGGGGGGKDGETATTVWFALGANLLIAVAKLAGGLIAGSPALLSEAAHSVADTFNEVFLLASLRRSRRPADDVHPFGYGKERFFWSLIAAVGIFVTGGCFSFFQGIDALRSGSDESTAGYLVGLVVLFLSLLAEGGSLVRGLFQARGEARRQGVPTMRVIRAGEDPALRTVLAEDSAACVGVVLAAAGMILHLVTGHAAYEGVASLLIGALLVYVAYSLGRSAKDQLIGVAADPALRRRVRAYLDRQPEVDVVTAALTMRLGPDAVMLAARIDLTPGVDSETVELALLRIRRGLREECPTLTQVFLDVTDASDDDRRRAARETRELDSVLDGAPGDADGPDGPDDGDRGGRTPPARSS